MKLRRRLAGMVAGATMLSGCQHTSPTSSVCLPDAIAAIDVAVVDAIRGVGPDAAILAIASRDGYSDSSRVAAATRSGPVHMYLAFDEAGSFRVEVQAQGYMPWSRDSIVVFGDSCGHPMTASVTAELVPSSGH